MGVACFGSFLSLPPPFFPFRSTSSGFDKPSVSYPATPSGWLETLGHSKNKCFNCLQLDPGSGCGQSCPSSNKQAAIPILASLRWMEGELCLQLGTLVVGAASYPVVAGAGESNCFPRLLPTWMFGGGVLIARTMRNADKPRLHVDTYIVPRGHTDWGAGARSRPISTAFAARSA